MKNKYLSLIPLMLISGVLSALSSEIDRIFDKAYEVFLPGLIFGVCLGIYFVFIEKLPFRKFLIWIFASSFIFYLAFRIAFEDTFGRYLIAGALGTLFLTLVTSGLIKTIEPKKILLIVVLGAIGGIIFKLTIVHPDYTAFWSWQSALLPFVLWQMFVGVFLGVSAEKNISTS